MKVKVWLAREFSIHQAHRQRVDNATAGINSFLFTVTPAAHKRPPTSHTHIYSLFSQCAIRAAAQRRRGCAASGTIELME